MSFVVLDTDVASGAFRGTLPGRLRAQLASQTACITFVTLGELTKWTAVRSWGPQRRTQLEQWRRRLVLLPFDEQVAIIWGELQARHSNAAGLDRRTTPGSPPAAWPMSYRWLRSTPRTSRTSPRSTASA